MPRCVRNAELDELIRAWRACRPAGEGDVLEPGAGVRLPGRVLAVDLSNKVKLVESTFSGVIDGEPPEGVAVGDELSVKVDGVGPSRGVVLGDGDGALRRKVPCPGGLYGGAL